MAALVRLASDIGGTFTDVMLEIGATRHATKVLTTPKEPEIAVIEGCRTVLAEAGLGFSDVDLFVHGTTLATNAIIERKGAPTALIATQGFRDVLEIADESRFDQYDVLIEKPRPLVPRRWRHTVPERMDVEGNVLLALDEAAVRVVARRLVQDGIAAVAVSLIHAYANGAHERRVREILAEVAPGLSVTLSSEVCPEVREYERTSTAVANAYVQPMMAGYLARLETSLASLGSRAPIHLITSGGSLASLDTARRFPVRLVESGPAGGAILAAHVALERGEREILSFDMGGTTAKICLIENGAPLKARAFEVDRSSRFMKGSGLPLRIPVIEMIEIGAGGGSIASVDALGRFAVGPESAGSSPGPACYGRGGTRPTVTDADLLLGRIDGARFAGGRMALAPEASSNAVRSAIGVPLGLDEAHAAHGIVEIVEENMANAARVHAVERGVDVAGRTLIAFGGAAPLHACRLAEKLGISRIIVPADAGVGSAVGFLRAPAAYEIVRSRHMDLGAFDVAMARQLLDEMSREAHALAKSAAAGRALLETRQAFMRYTGQGHEVPVAVDGLEAGGDAVERLRTAFEAEYQRLFARHIPNARIEVMSWAVLVTTAAERPKRLSDIATKPAPVSTAVRSVHDAATRRRFDVAVYERDALKPGQALSGPALIVEAGTTTYVTPPFSAHVDAGGALVLIRRGSKS